MSIRTFGTTVRAPTVRAPTVRAPTVRAPTVRAPTVRAPTVRAPTVRAPTVPTRRPLTMEEIKDIISDETKFARSQGSYKNEAYEINGSYIIPYFIHLAHKVDNHVYNYNNPNSNDFIAAGARGDIDFIEKIDLNTGRLANILQGAIAFNNIDMIVYLTDEYPELLSYASEWEGPFENLNTIETLDALIELGYDLSQVYETLTFMVLQGNVDLLSRYLDYYPDIDQDTIRWILKNTPDSKYYEISNLFETQTK